MIIQANHSERGVKHRLISLGLPFELYESYLLAFSKIMYLSILNIDKGYEIDISCVHSNLYQRERAVCHIMSVEVRGQLGS